MTVTPSLNTWRNTQKTRSNMEPRDNEIDIDPEYLKGFNSGYLLAEANPELATSLSNAIPESFARATGFKDGVSQLVLEKEQLYPSWMSNAPETPDKQDYERGQEREDFDLEIE